MKYVVLACALAGCISDDLEATDTGATEQASFVQSQAPRTQNGTQISFETITNPTGGITINNVEGLAACDATSLYAAEKSGSLYALWYSKDSGQTWKKQTQTSLTKEIACDHSHLAMLDGGGKLWIANLAIGGAIGTWISHDWTGLAVDHIQGGDGSFYGTKANGAGFDVYVTSTQQVGTWTSSSPTGHKLVWTKFVGGIGGSIVTGTGAVITGTDGAPAKWPRRAFTLEASGTISTNPTLLDKANLWTWLDVGSQRYTLITAATSNMIYGLQKSGTTTNLARIKIQEIDCDDGVDNDLNGLTDGEDSEILAGAPACRQVQAQTFCATHANGTYCGDRFQPATFFGQPNQNTELVYCLNHTATIYPGVCKDASAPGYDQLIPDMTLAAPAGTAKYCNVHYTNGTWGFSYTGADPCATLLDGKAGEIVRAGLYSTTGTNWVFVQCSNGYLNPGAGTGSAPLAAAYGAVGHTANRCIFQISPEKLPIWSQAFAPQIISCPDRGSGAFQHSFAPMELSVFNAGDSGMHYVNRVGKSAGDSAGEQAIDVPVDEGVPLMALTSGTVIGSRIRDISRNAGGGGGDNQGEVYIRYDIGAPPYRESFVVYYAHIRRSLVLPGQTVKRGQIVGYVGATGATGGFGHLHAGVFRLTNTNAHTPTASFGHDMTSVFALVTTETDASGNNFGNKVAVDPLGWANYSQFDPSGYTGWSLASGSSTPFTGIGGWSPSLWVPGYAGFQYPCP